ncbi:hypothetical protein [Hansschlegelia zhihuaiae]|uniref:FkbM family methyltransferase n=1 Tax=Hansschlegelia zhihuaiae TaxID=405005 RepID=A0A4Q0MN22_9HYPH|nr:hypothetical protein [Hansschlegelia zhihuaiae]RXF74469.1 hypothetical protein EK403_06585 [Hansschlegelia zhihuaiae]
MSHSVASAAPYDEIFARIERRRIIVPAGFHMDSVGQLTRFDHMLPTAYVRRMRAEALKPYPMAPNPPPPENPHRYELGAVLYAALSSRDRFTMIELGAGIAPWCVTAACGLRALDPKPLLLVGVEAEPSRFAWMRQHLIDNDLNPDAHIQIQAAILPSDDWKPFALFPRGVPNFGGHRVVTDLAREHETSGVTESPHFDPGQDTFSLERIEAVTLEMVLDRLPAGPVDLVHMDIQGIEERVVAAAVGPLTERVRHLAIGTHSVAIDQGLRELLSGQGWTLHFALESLAMNHVGDAMVDLSMDDGFQHWINSRL